MNSPNNNNHNNLVWCEDTENILRGWGEMASVYSYLHEQSHIYNNRKNLRFQIPSIIISTLSGFISMSLSSFSLSQENKNYFGVGIGSLNIGVGIISTVLSILKYSELSQRHLTSSVLFKKLYIEISTELGLDRMSRKPITNFLKTIKTQYETLIETSPIISKHIISKFNKKADVEIKHLPSEITLKFDKIYISNDDKVFQYVENANEESV
jgi:hypothetical protein